MKFQFLLWIALSAQVFAAESTPTNLSDFEGNPEVNKTDKGFEFFVKIPKDIHYNFKAPWKLKIDGAIEFEQGKKFRLGKESLKEKKFTITYKPKSKGTSNYEFRFGLCDVKGDKCKFFKKKGTIKL